MIRKKRVITICGASVGLLPFGNLLCYGAEPKQTTPPNIIYILADDMGYGDIRALNSDGRIPTPALDRMVATGLTFTDAHSNSAVSTPTRYGTLTGRYAFRSRLKKGVLVGHEPALIEKGRETVASFLRTNGYRTACIGKWHLGLDWQRKDAALPLFEGDPWQIKDSKNVDYTARVGGGPSDCGFDYSYIIPASLDIAPYIYLEDGRATAPVTHYSAGWRSDEARGMWYRPGDQADDFAHEECLQQLTKQAVRYIQQAAESPKPFFLYFPLTAPHTPWLPSEAFRGSSGAGVYGDFVCMVDDVVRQVYQALDESGQGQNTLVIFTSDNGSSWLPADIQRFNHRANGPYSGMKSDLWEGGHRVPYLATWPAGIEPGTTSGQLLCSTDLMATCAEMLGKQLPQDAGEDSYSFWKALRAEPADRQMRRSMIYHSIEGLFAFRQDEWVFLDCKGSGGWSLSEQKAEELPFMQLYNLQTDPAEQTNLVEQHPARVEAMKELLMQAIERGSTRPL